LQNSDIIAKIIVEEGSQLFNIWLSEKKKLSFGKQNKQNKNKKKN